MIALEPVEPARTDLLADLRALVALLSDPGAAAERIDALHAAAKTASEAIAEARHIQEEAAAAREASIRGIAAATQKHEEKLAVDRSDFEEKIRQRESDLLARETRSEVLAQHLNKRKAEIEAMRAEIQQRLDAVKRAAGAS